jgi:hypothetical protein
MKLFVIMYGLMAFVPQEKNVTVLLLDSGGLKYFDGEAAPEHAAALVYMTPAGEGSQPVGARLSFAGEDLLIDFEDSPALKSGMLPATWRTSKGSDVSSTIERTFIHAHRLTADKDEARVDSKCLATESGDCSKFLSGRVIATGDSTMFPLDIMVDGTREWTSPTESSRDVWAFRDPVTNRRSGTYEGEFSQSIGLVGNVPAAATTKVRARIGNADLPDLTVSESSVDVCEPYLRLIDDDSAGRATCFLLQISNIDPAHLDEDHPAERSHLPLLDHLAKQRTPRPLEPYKHQTVNTIAAVGNPKTDPCAGKIMWP